MEIRVDVVAPDGLSKEVFEFNYQYGALEYTSHWKVNRSTKREVWADVAKPKYLSFEKYCERNNLDSYDEESEIEYNRYRRRFFPTCQKTRQGKTKLSGISACIDHLPVCPDSVAEQARKKFAESFTVRYKRTKEADNGTSQVGSHLPRVRSRAGTH